MNVRRANLEDYREIVTWWKKQNRAILSWDLLPVLSFIAEEEGKPIAVSWLYLSDSIVGFVGWTTRNPDIRMKKVAQALALIQDSIAYSAHKAGLKMLFQFSGGRGFSRLLLKSGWTNTMIQHDFLMKEI